MSKPKYSAMNYISAIQHKAFDQGIQIITELIDDVDPNDKRHLVNLLKKRTKTFFRIEKYDMVLIDCNKLRSINYNIDDDRDMAALEAESDYRVSAQKAVERFKYIALKFGWKKARKVERRIQRMKLNRILKK